MAVHVPLSAEAQAEARLLMLAAQNILNPKDGKPVVTPSQDMVLGNYYLTLERKGATGEGSTFYGPEEVLIAYQYWACTFAFAYRNCSIIIKKPNIYGRTKQDVITNNCW